MAIKQFSKFYKQVSCKSRNRPPNPLKKWQYKEAFFILVQRFNDF